MGDIRKVGNIVKVEFMADLMHCIALDCTIVPNKVNVYYTYTDTENTNRQAVVQTQTPGPVTDLY